MCYALQVAVKGRINIYIYCFIRAEVVLFYLVFVLFKTF